MKQLIITVISIISICQFSNAQIIDSLPYFQQDKILNQTLNPFFSAVVYNEGVAALKATLDPDFKPKSSGVSIENMQTVLIGGYYLGQAYTSASRYKKPLDAYEAITLERGIHPGYPDSSFVFAIFEIPMGKQITKRGPFDLLAAYDLNPNDLSFQALGNILPLKLMNKIKANPDYISRVFGLLLVEKPNGQYKVYPKVDKKVKLISAASKNNSEKSSFHAHNFKGTDEELQALKLAQSLLKAIRSNDPVAFKKVFDEDLVKSQVWTDMRPLPKYRKLKEYTTQGLDFEKVLSFENQAGWRGHFAFYAVVYRLPEGMNASELRAPSDLFNRLHWEEVNLQDLESQDKIKALKAGFAPMPENSILLGPILAGLPHEHQNPLKYITVLVVKNPDTNNFNIGMPPTLK